MNLKTAFSARNRINAAVYGLLAYATTSVVFAQAKAEGKGVIVDFLNNIGTILNAASLVVVTIAIVFAGYQIAFNNKRISEVAPVLIGGVLIGGAGQIAAMLINSGTIGTAK